MNLKALCDWEGVNDSNATLWPSPDQLRPAELVLVGQLVQGVVTSCRLSLCMINKWTGIFLEDMLQVKTV